MCVCVCGSACEHQYSYKMHEKMFDLCSLIYAFFGAPDGPIGFRKMSTPQIATQ